MHYLLNMSTVTTSSMPNPIQSVINREPVSQRGALPGVYLLRGTPQQQSKVSGKVYKLYPSILTQVLSFFFHLY